MVAGRMLAAALILCTAGAALAEGVAAGRTALSQPQRVVSVNLCTDQLAMLIAAPGQLRSVSWLAADPAVSVMAGQAEDWPQNDGSAEQVFLMQPDLVLAGTYSTGPAVQMLRRLGIRVETLPPANSITDIRAGITRMGLLLDQPERAARLLAAFDADLAAIHPLAPRLAASYAANGFSDGQDSLAGDAMRHAGLRLIAEATGGATPLETLVMAAPEVLVTGSRYAPPSRAEAVLDHPAFRAIKAARYAVPDRDWMCGLPAIADTIAQLAR
ncbi:ABC transporter substrate-binding protein [Paracoccus jeotgali]|uniref:ABC transporter substrate-binding protein n=1 Tax=Paracoccus jeotgali TaxID=2065379 RepID=A0A2K9MJ84_9RHOB|nr:ABC transporter substrate-binding protein [Paracoccus jeotgali]AUM74595.1 ABC transporter substrate-binding protein [Paracoccus jeotgali]